MAISSGGTMPRRSASLPMKMPPAPKPSISKVYGSDASARVMPKSACTVGSATMNDHMPTPPMVLTINVHARRRHA